MKVFVIAMAVLLLAGLSFAQSSDDPDVQHLDSLSSGLDSLTLPDNPVLLHLVDSLSAAEPQDYGSVMQVGRSDLNAGRIEEALAEFDKAVQMMPQEAKGWSEKGKSLTMLNRPQEALPALNRAIELDPRLAEARFTRAGAHSLMNRPEAALQDLESALAADPTLKDLARTSTFFRSLYDNPEFKRLVK
ncbi:MAG TPA: tetratricopeptide repeat protein [bacterium]|jgi:tetratricopeptide (TPR) repeat protein